MHSLKKSRTEPQAPSATQSAARLVVVLTSVLALGGCQAIKGIFEVGFGLGVILVIALVATIGGIIAMVSRK